MTQAMRIALRVLAWCIPCRKRKDLCTAAPALLTALRECAHVIEMEAENYRDDGSYQPHGRAFLALANHAKAVIAQATGGRS